MFQNQKTPPRRSVIAANTVTLSVSNRNGQKTLNSQNIDTFLIKDPSSISTKIARDEVHLEQELMTMVCQILGK